MIAETRLQADGDSTGRWSSGTVIRFLDLCIRREWSRIFAAYPGYRHAKRTITATSTGTFPLTSLSASGERFFRILQMRVGDQIVAPLTGSETPYSSTDSSQGYLGRRSYAVHGANVQLYPASADTVSVWVSHLPASIASLEDTDPVVFPEDYELIPCFEAAALMLSKGSAETGAANELRAMAKDMRDDMISDVGRHTIGPNQIGFPDNSADWGG